MSLSAPFPWFGGKSRAAHLVWAALGDVNGYVEPFAGSLAVLLARPTVRGVETVNDRDAYLANFWRALRHEPDAVAHHADWPVSEVDLSARHLWLVNEGRAVLDRMAADPDAYDAKIAGWWVWGLCSWIGSGWCSGEGPWVRGDDGLLNRKIPHLGDAGRGVNRQIPHLGDAGRGVNRQIPHLGNAEQGVHGSASTQEWMRSLSTRLRGVRIACGDWTRIMGPSVLRAGGGKCGVLLDPPYVTGEDLYAEAGDGVCHEVFRWAEEHGDDSSLRIVVCGYEGDWSPPAGWKTVPWKARRAFNSKNDGSRERLWCSPACLTVEPAQRGLELHAEAL